MQSNSLYKIFRELTAVYSPTFGERDFCGLLKNKLSELGVVCEEDHAGSQIGGNCGNLYGFLSGELTGEPLLFSAHMDTVEPAAGKESILREDGRITSGGATILGADDVSGIAIILEALTRLREAGTPHRAIELLFPVAEERYGAGSAVADYSKFHAKAAYVLDLGGEIGMAANAAPTILSFTAIVKGKAAHAGFAPKDGVHAISAAAKAIAKIPLGEPEPGVTCNIGVISGGEAGNIVPETCTVTGEIRSLSHDAVLERWEKVRSIFEEEAKKAGASVSFAHRCEITAYETPVDSAVVRRFKRACETAGVPCHICSTLGGSDNNNFALHGIEGIVIACSMHDVHSTREYANLHEMEQCVRLVMNLMTEETP
ncbi:MAG: M20/M25/M40 family metallo-hydrolase [Oscillospiraceae bacterium]|nr:M20/M25/M40 family metallo-hydrolase [Oscillospiraceae bacterium]